MIRRLFTRSTECPTPILAKVGLVAAGWVYAGGIVSHLTAHRAAAATNPVAWSLGVLFGCHGVACVVAAWRMKRWAVIALVVLGLLTVAMAANLLFMAALRFVPLVPVLIYWRDMTWN